MVILQNAMDHARRRALIGIQFAADLSADAPEARFYDADANVEGREFLNSDSQKPSQRGSRAISAIRIYFDPVSIASRIDAIAAFSFACATCRFVSFLGEALL